MFVITHLRIDKTKQEMQKVKIKDYVNMKIPTHVPNTKLHLKVFV